MINLEIIENFQEFSDSVKEIHKRIGNQIETLEKLSNKEKDIKSIIQLMIFSINSNIISNKMYLEALENFYKSL